MNNMIANLFTCKMLFNNKVSTLSHRSNKTAALESLKKT